MPVQHSAQDQLHGDAHGGQRVRMASTQNRFWGLGKWRRTQGRDRCKLACAWQCSRASFFAIRCRAPLNRNTECNPTCSQPHRSQPLLPGFMDYLPIFLKWKGQTEHGTAHLVYTTQAVPSKHHPTQSRKAHEGVQPSSSPDMVHTAHSCLNDHRRCRCRERAAGRSQEVVRCRPL